MDELTSVTFYFHIYLFCVYVRVYAHHRICVEVRVQFAGAGSLFPPCGLYGSSSGWHNW